MKTSALRLHRFGTPPGLSLDDIDVVSPGKGEVLLQTQYAGLNPFDAKLASGKFQDKIPLTPPFVLGIESSGYVKDMGEGVPFTLEGVRVAGVSLDLGGPYGAFADWAIVPAASLVVIPEGLDSLRAAALPVDGLTAWQALFEHGKLTPGQRVLINGASGGVGTMAVQLARRAGATVVGTAGQDNLGYLSSLGAAQTAYYGDPQAVTRLGPVDLIVDLSGEADRLWPLLVPGGKLVSPVDPAIAEKAPPGLKGEWVQMRFDAATLRHLMDLVVARDLEVTIAKRWAWKDAPQALERRTEGKPGKAVIELGNKTLPRED